MNPNRLPADSTNESALQTARIEGVLEQTLPPQEGDQSIENREAMLRQDIQRLSQVAVKQVTSRTEE
ncbi:MAG: hypothetical protein WD467_01890 [Candidatus Saccharimonadales bacterium]